MQQPSPAPEFVTVLPVIPTRAVESNKGSYGKVLVVAGSRGMSGAAVLCASAALRGGAGLVRLAVPSELLPIVASANPCYLTAPLPQDERGLFEAAAEAEILSLASASDVLAFGPGIGRSPALDSLVAALVARTAVPTVLDADALNAFQQYPERLHGGRAPLILTPHPGEFARLLAVDTATVQADREELAARFARDHAVILVLKGHATVVTDGRRIYCNSTGNPGMATGGTGDVLTGLVAALLAQRLEPFAAAQLGVYVHGLAGDLARDELGEVSLIASDLLHYLPRAFCQL
jgi:ADP-dependent NAD(P)H-hydrate dehydratase